MFQCECKSAAACLLMLLTGVTAQSVSELRNLN